MVGKVGEIILDQYFWSFVVGLWKQVILQWNGFNVYISLFFVMKNNVGLDSVVKTSEFWAFNNKAFFTFWNHKLRNLMLYVLDYFKIVFDEIKSRLLSNMF